MGEITDATGTSMGAFCTFVTKMGFRGLLNESDRQAIISYLKGLKNKK